MPLDSVVGPTGHDPDTLLFSVKMVNVWDVTMFLRCAQVIGVHMAKCPQTAHWG